MELTLGEEEREGGRGSHWNFKVQKSKKLFLSSSPLAIANCKQYLENVLQVCPYEHTCAHVCVSMRTLVCAQSLWLPAVLRELRASAGETRINCWWMNGLDRGRVGDVPLVFTDVTPPPPTPPMPRGQFPGKREVSCLHRSKSLGVLEFPSH